MNRRIINPVTGTAYELRNRSSKAGVKPRPKGLWSASRKEMNGGQRNENKISGDDTTYKQGDMK